MASLKKISIGAASYDIIPDAITDSNANYKASCPTISSNTTIEVASNKTTVINSSSSDTQYPSAKAVFTAIQNASKAGTFASNILTNINTAFVPLVSSGGMFSTTYLQNLAIPENKTISLINASSGSTVNSMLISGTISTLALQNSATNGKITKFETGSNTEIGDSSEPTSDTTEGQNGLFGSGTVYISATGASDPSTSSYAFTGTIQNKAGISDSIQGGYIGVISNGAYATIAKLFNFPYSNIGDIENSGTIDCLSLYSSGKIKVINIGTGTTIGDAIPPTTSDTTIGHNGLYGDGTIYIAATSGSTDSASTSPYAFKGSIINKAGINTSLHGGYIGSIVNKEYATINQIQNVSTGTITNIENSGYIGQMHNTGTIDYLYADGGSVTAIVGQSSTAGIYLGPSSTYPLWDVVVHGKVNPWQEVSIVENLVTFLNLQTGILYKYTGSTTTYNGVTYTSGNFYRYEA